MQCSQMSPSAIDPGQALAALHAPIAPYTWEVQATLLRTVQETGRIPLRWNRPVEIIGMYAAVRQASVAGGLLVPTTDDLVCALSANQEDRFTNRLEDVSQTAMAETFVTLAALSVQVPRLMRIMLTNAAPQVDIAFRWKTHNPIGTPRFEDALISVAFYCRYISG
ncbi:MAG: hypothetical protein A2Y74_05345 [Actinobacteria bacterium RBG_13_63_9]|nr:MAG: hypothetical protein A2Y74_05345 [Actinobacteria bacterium RBG_13_63_9]